MIPEPSSEQIREAETIKQCLDSLTHGTEIANQLWVSFAEFALTYRAVSTWIYINAHNHFNCRDTIDQALLEERKKEDILGIIYQKHQNKFEIALCLIYLGWWFSSKGEDGIVTIGDNLRHPYGRKSIYPKHFDRFMVDIYYDDRYYDGLYEALCQDSPDPTPEEYSMLCSVSQTPSPTKVNCLIKQIKKADSGLYLHIDIVFNDPIRERDVEVRIQTVRNSDNHILRFPKEEVARISDGNRLHLESLKLSDILGGEYIGKDDFDVLSLVLVVDNTILLDHKITVHGPWIPKELNSFGKLMRDAMAGSEDAAFDLFCHYFEIHKETEALRWGNMSVKSGNPYYLYRLGWAQLELANYDKSLRLFRRLWEITDYGNLDSENIEDEHLKHFRADTAYALALLTAQCLPDGKKALWYAMIASANGVADADSFLTDYDFGTDITPDLGMDYFNLYLSRTKTGDIDMIRVVARCYLYGSPIERNLNLAEEMLTSAAEKGDVNSIRLLAKMYDKGHYLQKNRQKAIYWAQKYLLTGENDALTIINRDREGKEKALQTLATLGQTSVVHTLFHRVLYDYLQDRLGIENLTLFLWYNGFDHIDKWREEPSSQEILNTLTTLDDNSSNEDVCRYYSVASLDYPIPEKHMNIISDSAKGQSPSAGAACYVNVRLACYNLDDEGIISWLKKGLDCNNQLCKDAVYRWHLEWLDYDSRVVLD